MRLLKATLHLCKCPWLGSVCALLSVCLHRPDLYPAMAQAGVASPVMRASPSHACIPSFMGCCFALHTDASNH